MVWICPICSSSNDELNICCFVCDYERQPSRLPLDELQRLFEIGSVAYSEGDFESAFRYLEMAAKYKYTPALVLIAECYKNGTGTACDEVKMYEAYMLAARKGDSKAQYELACCCYSGTGTKKNNSRVLTWLEKSAQQDYVPAMKMLAEFYLSGEIVACDYEKALELYNRLLMQCGHWDSDVLSGISHCKTELSKKEFDDCVLAANRGDASAQYSLACRFYFGSGTMKNLSQTVLWLQKAAGQRHIDAQKMLASLYLNGEGVACDYDKAIELYKAAEHDFELEDETDALFDPEVYVGLGRCYAAKNNHIFAVWYYRKAAKSGYAEGQFLLAECYVIGKGIIKSYLKAKKWYSKAAKGGYEKARIALEELELL